MYESRFLHFKLMDFIPRLSFTDSFKPSQTDDLVPVHVRYRTSLICNTHSELPACAAWSLVTWLLHVHCSQNEIVDKFHTASDKMRESLGTRLCSVCVHSLDSKFIKIKTLEFIAIYGISCTCETVTLSLPRLLLIGFGTLTGWGWDSLTGWGLYVTWIRHGRKDNNIPLP